MPGGEPIPGASGNEGQKAAAPKTPNIIRTGGWPPKWMAQRFDIAPTRGGKAFIDSALAQQSPNSEGQEPLPGADAAKPTEPKTLREAADAAGIKIGEGIDINDPFFQRRKGSDLPSFAEAEDKIKKIAESTSVGQPQSATPMLDAWTDLMEARAKDKPSLLSKIGLNKNFDKDAPALDQEQLDKVRQHAVDAGILPGQPTSQDSQPSSDEPGSSSK